FQFTPPGTDLVYLLFFRIFGPSIWVTNLVVLCVGVLFAWACFRVASTILGRVGAGLASLLCLMSLYVVLLDGTPACFILLAVLAGIDVLFRGATLRNLAFAGGLFGIASFFTQTRGVFALLGVVAWLLATRHDATRPQGKMARKLAFL